jgi:hypothetical protein
MQSTDMELLISNVRTTTLQFKIAEKICGRLTTQHEGDNSEAVTVLCNRVLKQLEEEMTEQEFFLEQERQYRVQSSIMDTDTLASQRPVAGDVMMSDMMEGLALADEQPDATEEQLDEILSVFCHHKQGILEESQGGMELTADENDMSEGHPTGSLRQQLDTIVCKVGEWLTEDGVSLL